MRKSVLLFLLSLAASSSILAKAAFSQAEVDALIEAEDISAEVDGRIIVRGAGATFPERLYQQAIFAYRFVNESIDVSYTGMGSSNGKCRILNGSCSSFEETPIILDFAGSDSLLSETDYLTYPSAQMYPAVAGAVVPIYNLPLLDALGHTLVLNLTTLARIFRLEITEWNHTDIVGLNILYAESASVQENIQACLSNEDYYQIHVVVREDGSGTSEILKETLSNVDPTFESLIGRNASNENYDTFLSGVVTKRQGNEGVAGFVATKLGSVGYSVLGEALAVGLSFASLAKTAGYAPVVAKSDTVSNALVEKGLGTGSRLEEDRLTVEISNAQGPHAWPIVGYTYFVIMKDSSRRKGAQKSNVLALQNFLEWFYLHDVPRSMAVNLAFAPLTEKVREKVIARLREDMVYSNAATGELEPVFDDEKPSVVSYFGAASLKNILKEYELIYEAEHSDISFDEFYESTASEAFERAQDEGVAITSGSRFNWKYHNGLFRLPYAGIGLGVLMNFCGAHSAVQNTSACEITKNGLKEPGENGINMTPSVLTDIFGGSITTWDDSRIQTLNPDVELPSEGIIIVRVLSLDDLAKDFGGYLEKTYEPSTIIAQANCSATNVVCVDTVDAQKSAIASNQFSLGYMPVLGSIPDLTEWVKLPTAGSDPFVPPSTGSIQACFVQSFYDADRASFEILHGDLPDNCYPAVQTLDIMARQDYTSTVDGGCDKTGVDFGLKNTRFIGFLMRAVLDGSEVTSEGSPLAAEGAIALYGLDFSRSTNYNVLASITCDGVSILTPTEDAQLVPLAFLVFAYVLTGMAILFCVVLIVWVQLNKTRRLLLVASPPFLLQILSGGIIALTATIPLSFQDDGIVGPSTLVAVDLSDEGTVSLKSSDDKAISSASLNLSCMLAPVLYGMGFAIVYSSLWLKTWRQIHVFNDERLRLQYVTNKKLRIYQFCLIVLLTALFAYWWVTDPLIYTRILIKADDEGNALESYGLCRSDYSIKLAAPIIALLCLSLVYGLYLSFKSRNIPSEFNEGRFITIAVIAAFEVLAISIPVFFSTSSDPTTNFILQFFIIFVTSAGTIMLIFIPKLIIRFSHGWETGNDGKSEVSDEEMSDDAGDFSRFPLSSITGSQQISNYRTNIHDDDDDHEGDEDPFQVAAPFKIR